jgi:hypothetical protein
MQKAAAYAQSAGTNFYAAATVGLAVGKTFAQSATAEGRSAVALAPFSESTTELPEISDETEFNRIKYVTFNTPVGAVSRFVPDNEGGFVLHVQSVSAPDAAKKAADLPAFMSQLRRSRQNEAFNSWIVAEMGREFRNSRYFQELQSDAK